MIDANSYTLTNVQKEHLRESSIRKVESGADASLLEAGFPVDELARQLFISNSPFLVVNNLPVESLDSKWSVDPTPSHYTHLFANSAPDKIRSDLPKN